MVLWDDLNSCAPQLRRYARALVAGHAAPNEVADDLVHAVLLRASETGASLPKPELHLHLYSLLTEWHREKLAVRNLAQTQMETKNSCARGLSAAGKLLSPAVPRDQLAAALLALPLEEREALLLVVLEGFSYAQAARILKTSRTMLVSRVARARLSLGDFRAIEDRPLPARVFPSYLRVVK